MTDDTPRKIRVKGVGLSATCYEQTAAWIAGRGRAGTPGYVCVCNVHTVMEASRDAAYAACLNGAAIATPDGMPLVWALRKLGEPQQQRVYGPDLLLACAQAWNNEAQNGSDNVRDGAVTPIRNYFYGAGPGVAQELAQTLSASYPGFICVGAESPPFRELTDEEDRAAIQRINDSGAQVLWVGLGAPKQERWMAAHAGEIRPVMVGVGAAFDFLTGRVRQAPRWMMRCGLEWLFRLAVEPRRLWRRYAVNNPGFLWYLLTECGKGKRDT